MKIKPLLEARYYNARKSNTTPGRAANKVVKDAFEKYGRQIYEVYNDKNKNHRRLSYTWGRGDWQGQAVPPFKEVKDDIISEIEAGLHQIGFRNFQVQWHDARTMYPHEHTYSKLVVRLPLTYQ